MKYFAAIFLLATFFRFYLFPIHPSGLYWDEYDTGYQAYSLLQTGRDYFGNLMPAHLQAFADYRSGLYMYLTVPFIKIFGLTPAAIRLTSAIFSLISLFFIYYLARKHLGFGRLAWLPVMVAAFAPWLMVQGRIAAESTLIVPFLLLGLIGFFELNWLAALGFGLTLWSYGTAKLFLPLFLISLLIIYRKSIANLALPLLLFLLICAPVVVETFQKPIAKRMSELSVFTDPTTASDIDYRRLQAALGAGVPRQVGMSPSLVEKAVYNKVSLWGSKILANYAASLSTDFLFLKGDPELRHNLNAVNTGQFYLIEIVPFLLGLFFLYSQLITPNSKLLLLWLLIAPLASVITRDGGNHAPRLIFLFPVIVFIIAFGLKSLFRNRKLFSLYILLYILSVSFAGYYFFSTYRTLSAPHFNSGFAEAVSQALAVQKSYDQVIIDTHNENILMAYLFVSGFSPKLLQHSFPLPSIDITTGVSGYSFGNITLLYPGTRNWNQIKLSGHNLIIAISP
jgi:4-amino-4-deoxy-L-arabinose transferase-like glycosyltransferase